jgi:steroid 5-alpha reductase family enzyme
VTTIDWGHFGWVLLTAAVVVVLAMTLTALWGRRLHRVAVVDVAWGATFAAVAMAAGVVAGLLGDGVGTAWRRWLLVGLVVVWGGRLAWHLRSRVRGAGHDDPRYEELLGGPFDEVPFSTVVTKVFALQGVAILVVSLPVLVGLVTSVRWTWVVVVGVLLWLVGLGFEAVGDAQLTAYQRRPRSSRPPVLDSGLWAWTRHPNYFGDACVWWGLWLVGGAASGWVALLVTLVAPVVMTWFLTVVSGARLTDRRMRGRPGWATYEARTPMFFPRPPRR